MKFLNYLGALYARTFDSKHLHRSLLLFALLLGSAGGQRAWGQSIYVIHNGNNYLSHNATSGAVNTARVTTFDPTTCFWTILGDYNYICPVNTSGTVLGNLYLRPRSRNSTYSLNTNTSTFYATWSELSDGGQPSYYSRYLRLNNDTWEVSTTNSNRGTLRLVEVLTVSSTSTAPTINGAALLTTTGNSNYTVAGGAYQQGGYTNYRFNNTDHFFYGNTAPVAATLGTATWTLQDNSYATVNGSGVVTVNSLPTNDVTLTLTVTIPVSGGTPAAPSGTTLTASKEITILSTKPSAPIINVSGTTATINTEAAGTTTIRYTLDGSEPTATTGTVYSGAIDLSTSTTSPVTIKAVTVRDGNTSDVSTGVITLALPEPVITINADTGTATISATSGATIYYTTDGSIPTTSSTQYTGSLSGLTMMTTIKAIAVKNGWNNSPIASETVTIPSGVSGGTVTLFDYEDHNWSYYQSSDNLPDGYPTDYLSSPDPRNVKITYKGGSVSGASAVAISALTGEGQNEMVYYKTLEKSVPGMTGNYPYTVISNPFSKRPATGSGNIKTYYGFAGWKVVSGGEYIQEYSDGQTLPLDATIHFTGLDTDYTPNCTSATIEFEATWTQATVKTGSSAQSFTGGTYETNFWVLTGNPNNTVTVPANCTMTARYPDGTVSWDGNFTRAITAGGNSAKVEFINMNSESGVSAAGFTFTIGRGIVNSNTGGRLTGCEEDKNCVQTVKVESGTYSSLYNFYAGLSSSRTCNQLMILGCDYDRAKNDNTKLIVRGNMYIGQSIQLNRTANSLYTRTYIKSGNLGSTVAVAGNNSYTGAGGTNTYYYSVANTHNAGRRYLCMEGGRIDGIAGGMDETNNQTTTARAFDLRVRGTAQIDGVVYGAAEYANARGTRTMIFTGGTVNGWVAGGANGTQQTNGGLTGATYLYVGGKTVVNSNNSTQTLNRAVGGNVFGAGCGYSAGSSSGQILTYNTNVVVADESQIERGVYGGGSYGYTTNTSNIYILGGTVAGKKGGVNGTTYSANITGGVFGGACQNRGGTVNIYMDDGLVKGGVYGGSNATGTISGNVTMHINGGQVGTSSEPANIHGGGYGEETVVSGNVDLTLGAEGQSSDGVTVYGDVYGGSALGSVNGTSATTTYHTYVTLNNGVINGSLYGGALGDAGTAANVYGPVQVKVYGGSVRKTDENGSNGSGGVYGANNVNGAPQRSVTVDIYGTAPAPDKNSYALYAVYGGGNQADYTYGNGYPTVTVHNCDNSIEYVYGGGNAAAVSSTDVTVWGGNVIGNVFGGGNGTVTAADVNGNATTKIYGGTIRKVFGGSNSQGTISGAISVTAESRSETTGGTACPMQVEELYGGGNEAASNVGKITIGCMNADDMIENVYGGSNNARITGDIVLNMNGGRVGNLFGGNNTGNTVNGSITVNVEWNSSCSNNYLGNVYGGGNKAAYTTPSGKAQPTVNILNGTVSGNVFGGGLGETAVITGNPVVNIGDTSREGYKATIAGGVFGGGDAAAVAGNTTVNFRKSFTSGGGGDTSSSAGEIFGGGNEAGVSGTATLNITGGKVLHGIYGGCNTSGTVEGDITVNLSSAAGNNLKTLVGTNSEPANVHGGGFGKGTHTLGNVEVNVGTTDDAQSVEIHGDVYGGSAKGTVNKDTGNHTWVTLTKGTVYGDVYGGGLGDTEAVADVNGNVKVTQDGVALVMATKKIDDTNTVVTAGRIFGCNNRNGSPKGTVLVLVNKTVGVGAQQRTSEENLHSSTAAHTYELEAVYGGGNLAAYMPEDDQATGQYSGNGHAATKNPLQVVINGCDDVSIEYVYGGGNAASTPSTDALVLGAYELGNVFGGGNGKDKISTDGTTWTVNPGADVGYHGASIEYGTGVSSATIWGGTVHSAFGGSNTTGNVRTKAEINLDEKKDSSNQPLCPLILDEIYGGGNEAYMAGGAGINLGCISYLKEIYGGAKNASIGSDVELTITSGHFDRVFGGNNLGGEIQGSITVNIEETGCNPVTIGELYGCGNRASYTTPAGKPEPTVNIKSFTSIGRVFGGGLGASAKVTGNPTVNINEVLGENAGMTSSYAGTTRTLGDGSTVELPAHESNAIGVIGTVYGGGNAAPVDGNTIVNVGTAQTVSYVSGSNHDAQNVVGVSIRDNVFGGGLGESAEVSGNTNVQVGRKVE